MKVVSLQKTKVITGRKENIWYRLRLSQFISEHPKPIIAVGEVLFNATHLYTRAHPYSGSQKTCPHLQYVSTGNASLGKFPFPAPCFVFPWQRNVYKPASAWLHIKALLKPPNWWLT